MAAGLEFQKSVFRNQRSEAAIGNRSAATPSGRNRRIRERPRRQLLDLDGHMHEFVVHRERAAEKRGVGRRIGHQADDAGEAAAADAPDVQIGDAHVHTGAGDRLADFLDDRMIHFRIEQHAAGLAQQADSQTVTSTAPTTPMTGSSQATPKYLPPTSATMASTEVAASAITCR